MLICMKLTGKQLGDLHTEIVRAQAEKGLSQADIARISRVHPSQVARICSGQFKTISHNVMQICKALGVGVGSREQDADEFPPEWTAAKSSMRRLWDETPEGALAIAKLLNAIADLHAARPGKSQDNT